jgi:hypothetical protein
VQVIIEKKFVPSFPIKNFKNKRDKVELGYQIYRVEEYYFPRLGDTEFHR